MIAAAGYLQAVAATIRRDAYIFVSYRFRIAGQVLTMLFTMTMFYYVSKLVRPDVVGPRGEYFAYVVVGIVSLAILTAALNTSQIVRMELLAGTFERMIISPVGPVGGVVALMAFPIAYSIAFAGAMLTMGALVFQFPVHLLGIPPALAVAGLAALAFACIGLLFVAVLLSFKSAMGVSWVIAGLSLFGGVYFPVALFPGWIRWISAVQPFTPSVDLLRHLLLGVPSKEPVSLELLKLCGISGVLIPLSATALWLAVNFSRRRGTLMEY